MPTTRRSSQKLNFTKRALDSLPLPLEGSRLTVFDTNTPGLGMVTFPTGIRTFFHLRFSRGYPRRKTLGRYDELSIEQARGEAAKLNGAFATWKLSGYAGAPPWEKKDDPVTPTLGLVLEDYIETHLRKNAKNPDRAIKEVRWQFNACLSGWRNRPLSSILRKDVRERHAEIGKQHGEVTANRVLTFLRALFNYASDPDVALWSGANPCAKPKKILFLEAGRKRIIEDHEKPKFFKELEKELHRDLHDFILLVLATGARRGSVLQMRWDEIDWQHELWTISNPKGRKATSTPIVVPLTRIAVSVLKSRPHLNEWVFPGRKGHLTTVKKPWKAFIKRTGISDLTVHDLRRSFATQLGETGAATEIIGRALGHENNSAATKIYDRSQRQEAIRDAMTRATKAMLSTAKTTKRKLVKASGA